MRVKRIAAWRFRWTTPIYETTTFVFETAQEVVD